MAENTDPYSYNPSVSSSSNNTGFTSQSPAMGQIQDLFDTWDGKKSSTSTPSDVKVDPYKAADNYAMQHVRSEPTDLWETRSYNPETKERYKDVKSLYNDHFDPSADNERVAYENWDKWDAISTGLGRFKDSFLNSYVASAKTWPQAAKALFFGSTDYLFDSQNELDKQAYKQHLSDLENPVFYAPGTENDIFTKGFLAETIGNLGFTLGTMAEVGTEFVLGKLLEGATFGAASPVVEGSQAAKLPLLARVGTVWKNMFTAFKSASTGEKIAALGVKGLQVDRAAIQSTSKLFSLAPTLERFNNARKLVAETNTALKASTGIWDNALKIASNLPFVGEMADAGRLIRAGRNADLSTSTLFKIGAGGLRRSFAEWQMAAGEASVEMGGVYADLVDQLKDDYRKSHDGQDASGDDLIRMRDYAMKAAGADFGYNIAILGITNKIQFGNLMGKFSHDSKAVFQLRKALSEDASKLGVLGVEGIEKGTGKALTKLYNTNKTLGFFQVLPKIYEDFGAKTAAWELGKNTLKGLTKIELSEGLQENFQEVASSSNKTYYADLYNKGVADWSKSFNDAVDSQMTKQGYKTFLGGALTGLFLGPGYHVFGRAMTKVNKEAREHEQALEKSLDYMNKFYKSDSEKILSESIKQIKLQSEYNDGMVDGLLKKDKYQYHNNKDSALIQTVMHARRTGTMDYLVNFLDGYGNNFTEEQFKDAFGYTAADLGKGSHQEVMSDIANSVERFSDLYDKYQTKWQLYMTLDDYIEDPYSRQKFNIKQAALQDAITTAAFLEAKSQQSLIRAKDILQKVVKYKSLGNSVGASFMTMGSNEKLDDNILILQNEIKSIQEAQTAKVPIDRTTEKSLQEKKEELFLLKAIQYYLYDTETVPDPTNPSKTITKTVMSNIFSTNGAQKELAPLFARYFELKNKQQNNETKVDLSEVEDAMHDLYDYFSLGQDHMEYIDSVNLLNDPDKFGNYLVNMQNARIGAIARSLHSDMLQLAGLSEMAKKHVEDNSDLMDELLVFATSPLATIDNYMKLQEINNKITDLRFKANLERVETNVEQRKQETAKAEEGKTPEEIQKEKLKNSKIPLPILDMETEIRTLKAAGKDTSELEKQISDYMMMRYDLNFIQNSFPYEEQDKEKRRVERYYLDENGNKIVFANTVPVYTEFAFIPPTVEPIDNYEQVVRFLKVYEQAVYNNYKKQQANNAQVSDEKTKEVDNEKSSLKNFVGSPILLSGRKGKLEFKDNAYVFVPNDGGAELKIADELVNGKEPLFDDFTNLSIDHQNDTEENKEVFNTTENTIVDTQESGAVTVELDQTAENVYINGVKYEIIKDENGLATEFRRTYYKKKGKGQKVLHDRISGKNPKGADYCKRVNSLLMRIRPVPASTEGMQDEIDAYTTAIEEVKNELSDLNPREAGYRRMKKYQLNKIKNQDISSDILEIKTKFDNPSTRNELSNDDLLKLFMWADDLVKTIKKEFRTDLTDPFIWSQIQELEKEYVNPISSKINNGSYKPRTEGVETKPSAKKIGIQQFTESLTSGESKSDTTETGKDTGKSKSKKSRGKKSGGLKSAVEKVENKINNANQLNLDFSESKTADPFQDLDLELGLDILSAPSMKSLQDMEIAIKGEFVKPDDIGEDMRSIYEKIQMIESERETFSEDYIPELIVSRLMPKITPASAKKETGVKIGAKKEINPNLLNKKGKTVTQAAHEIWIAMKEENMFEGKMDESDVRQIIIDILTTGNIKDYQEQFKVGGPELTQLKKELRKLENEYYKATKYTPEPGESPFEKLNKPYC